MWSDAAGDRFSRPAQCTAWYYGAVGERLTTRLHQERLARDLAAVGTVTERAGAAAGDARCRLEDV